MIVREDQDSIAILRMEHGKANAIDVPLLEALDAELARVADSTSRAMVLTGTGSIFSAGVDLFRVLEGGRDYLEQFLPLLSDVLRRLFTYPLPVIAAVNGHAIAGGCILVAAADHRIMASGKGRVGVPELLVGVPFPLAALEILRFAVSDSVASRLAFSGATMQTDEALEAGLIDQIVEPDTLLASALAAARHLAAIPAGAFALTKRTLRAPVMRRLDEETESIDAEVLRAWCDESSFESIRGYLAKTVKRSG